MPVHYHHIIPSPHLWHPLTSKAGPWAGAGALLEAIKSRCCFSWVSRDSSSSRSLSFRSFSKRICSSRKRWLMVSTPLDLKTLDGVQGIADRVPKSGAMEEQASQMKPLPSRATSAWAYWISDFWQTFGGVNNAGCTPEGPSQH